MRTILAFLLSALALVLVACMPPAAPSPAAAPAPKPTPNVTLDQHLRGVLSTQGIVPLDPGPKPDPAKVVLGKALFFDKELSGNRDTSCATCHQPKLGTGDALSLSVGTGGLGEAPDRLRGAMRMLIPRNAPEIFNRGSSEWHTMFWDGRVLGTYDEGFTHPAEFTQTLPSGLDTILAAQAMFPVTSRAEMRGDPRDYDQAGQTNEVGSTGEKDLAAVWRALTTRLMAIPAYRELFAAAYPDVPADKLGFEHAANAIAAFEADAFTLLDSPWDHYLNGDDSALSDQAMQGALLFYGKAQCSQCHSGALLPDQKFHNIGVPQLGAGKGRANRYFDPGRERETGKPEDRFAFRTPPLRNVALTGPWMHNGAYLSLEDALRHHLNPQQAFQNYDLSQLSADVRSETQFKPKIAAELLSKIDPLVACLLYTSRCV